MTSEELKAIWDKEESVAQIKGWDFSHIEGRYEEEDSLPWNYAAIIRERLRDKMKLLDYDTGGGEFLLSLHHPYENTAATEGYPPNVQLCREKLLPLGIDLRECADASNVPFDDNSFDIMINRHGDFNPSEIRRMLKAGGFFITQQVGSENDRELVEAVLPGNKEVEVKRRICADLHIVVKIKQIFHIFICFPCFGVISYFFPLCPLRRDPDHLLGFVIVESEIGTPERIIADSRYNCRHEKHKNQQYQGDTGAQSLLQFRLIHLFPSAIL